jgi:hypothetical protein
LRTPTARTRRRGADEEEDRSGGDEADAEVVALPTGAQELAHLRGEPHR